MRFVCVIVILVIFVSNRAEFGFADLGKAVSAIQLVLQNFKTETTT